jgi:hypothetical protein
VRFPDATSVRDLVGVLLTAEVLSRSMSKVNVAAIGILFILIKIDEPGLRLL